MPLGRLGVGVIETVEEGAGRSLARSRKSNFGWRRAIRTRPTSCDLFVVVDRPAQELELPVGPPAHVEHPVRTAPLIDDDEPAVVGERLLARACTAAPCRLRSSGILGEREGLDR